MKDWLNKPALARVQRAVARQQPVAEEPPRAAQRSPFDEPMMVRHQHLLDVVGMIQQKHVERAEPDVRDLAILGAHSQQKRQRIAPYLGKAAKQEPSTRARWKHTKILLRRRHARRTILVAMMAIVLNSASGVARRPRLREEVEELFRDAGIDARIRELADPRATLRQQREWRSTRIPKPLSPAAGMERSAPSPSALAGTSTPLGVLPLGTLNHFAKDAGIPLDLRESGADRRRAPRRRRVDVARVNDRIFINNSSIGVYPSFVESRERLRAQGHSKWAGVRAGDRRSAAARRRSGDSAARAIARGLVARTPFVFVGNNEYLAEGIKLGARTRLDAGRLYAYFAPPVRTRDLPKLFAQALFGYARREHALESTGRNRAVGRHALTAHDQRRVRRRGVDA